MFNFKKHISSFKIIILGFIALIILGTLLLMLPISVRGQGGASFSDALFTATSAVCVTGLTVRDTATYWSNFGQFVILLLIQIGGMGVVTVVMAITKLAGKRIGLSERNTLKESIASPVVGGVVRMTGFIYKMVLGVELAGAVVLSAVFIPEYGISGGIWRAVFYSVSAFCNAGFDLSGTKQPFSSITEYSTNPVMTVTIMALLTVGGLGFFTWSDIAKNKFRIKKYKMQTKVILTVSAILVAVPAVYFFLFEYSDLPIKERVLGALFQSVTARTAGFVLYDFSRLSEAGMILMMGLMLIGGSPGSTAGGMKTTTAAVLFASAVSVLKKKRDTHFFLRRVPDDTPKNAAAVLITYLTLTITCSIAISRIESLPMMTALLETVSALSTVGITLGVTPTLCTFSRIILISLMFIGRVGGLTLIYAAVSDKSTQVSKYPKENITVG